MTIEDVIRVRRIDEVLHFTSHQGLVGILHTRRLKSRPRLKGDPSLVHILRLNTQRVLDPGWEDYVNLSISRINQPLFDISSSKWHLDVWWCILALDPVVLTHEDVHFVTTNNAYREHLTRGSGVAGLEALFANSVKGRYGTNVVREPGIEDKFPTDVQAEVLYPGEIDTRFLKRIYVARDEDHDHVGGLLYSLDHPSVEIFTRPELFGKATSA